MTSQLTLSDYFTGPGRVRRDKTYAADLTNEIRARATLLLARINALLAIMLAAKVPLAADPSTGSLSHSGWRPPAVNAATANAAPKSKHMIGGAIDLYDPGGAIDAWCMDNLDTLDRLGLWLEHPDSTDGWCHLQCLPPGSGRRVFRP